MLKYKIKIKNNYITQQQLNTYYWDYSDNKIAIYNHIFVQVLYLRSVCVFSLLKYITLFIDQLLFIDTQLGSASDLFWFNELSQKEIKVNDLKYCIYIFLFYTMFIQKCKLNRVHMQVHLNKLECREKVHFFL